VGPVEPGGECFGVGEQVGAEFGRAAVDGVGEVERGVTGDEVVLDPGRGGGRGSS
jgi:hypothetical protein